MKHAKKLIISWDLDFLRFRKLLHGLNEILWKIISNISKTLTLIELLKKELDHHPKSIMIVKSVSAHFHRRKLTAKKVWKKNRLSINSVSIMIFYVKIWKFLINVSYLKFDFGLKCFRFSVKSSYSGIQFSIIDWNFKIWAFDFW